jgi:hypothetical protein
MASRGGSGLSAMVTTAITTALIMVSNVELRMSSSMAGSGRTRDAWLD